MAMHYSPRVSSSGLILCLDAANTRSYPGTGTLWYDISGNNNHFTINASAYNSTGPKYMDFNGSYGCAVTTSGSDISINNATSVTAVVWTRIKNSSAEWRTLFRAETSNSDHQVIVQSGGWLIGMYDNTNSTWFNSSGFSQQDLPGYATNQWNMLVWRFVNVSDQYYNYNFTYNDSPSTLRGFVNSTNARFKAGFRTLGAYWAASPSQFWGDIAHLSLYNRYLSDNEIISSFQAHRGRFSV